MSAGTRFGSKRYGYEYCISIWGAALLTQ